MTVLFAFVSNEHDAAFICADNLEGISGSKAEKVFLQWRRFALGICGPGFLKDALGMIGVFDYLCKVDCANGQPAPVIAGVQQLASALENVLPRLAVRQDETFKRKLSSGEATHEQYDLWSDQCGIVVVLDYVDKKLFQIVNSTCIANLVAGIRPSLRVTGLPREQVFRFAGATPMAAVTPDIVSNPRAHAAQWVRDAAAGAPSRIGSLGSNVTISGADVNFQSAFDSVSDVLTSHGY